MRKNVQIDVKKPIDANLMECDLYFSGSSYKFYIPKREYDRLLKDGFFVRDGKKYDSAGVLNTTPLFKGSYEAANSKETIRQSGKVKMKSWLVYFSELQLAQMKEIEELTGAKPARLRRESLDYFINKIKLNEIDFDSFSESDAEAAEASDGEKLKLVNTSHLPEQIDLFNKLADQYNFPVAKMRREAWNLYYKGIKNGSITIYKKED